MESLKVKMSELLPIRDEMGALLAKEKLSFLAKFKISGLYKTIFGITEPFDTTRTEVIKKFGAIAEDGSFNIPEENQAEYKTEMQALLDAEETLQYEPLDIALIGNLETENLYYQVFRLFVEK